MIIHSSVCFNVNVSWQVTILDGWRKVQSLWAEFSLWGSAPLHQKNQKTFCNWRATRATFTKKSISVKFRVTFVQNRLATLILSSISAAKCVKIKIIKVRCIFFQQATHSVCSARDEMFLCFILFHFSSCSPAFLCPHLLSLTSVGLRPRCESGPAERRSYSLECSEKKKEKVAQSHFICQGPT